MYCPQRIVIQTHDLILLWGKNVEKRERGSTLMAVSARDLSKVAVFARHLPY